MRCPVCRADNNEGPNCRRCRADLSLLFALEERRTELLRQARARANQGDWPALVRLAEQAHALRHNADAAQLAAVGWLMQGDRTRAWQWYGHVLSQRS
jgi:hypothetical protein